MSYAGNGNEQLSDFFLFSDISSDVVKEIIESTIQSINENILLKQSPHYQPIFDWLTDTTSTNTLESTIQLIHSYSKLDANTMTEHLHQVRIHDSKLDRIPANHLVRHLTAQVITHKTALSQSSVCTDPVELTENDKRGLYYVGGALIHSLIATFKRLKHPDIVDSLSELVCDDPMMDYTDWTVRLSRGGLVYVTETFFDFLIVVETRAQLMLNSRKLGNSPLLTNMLNCIMDDDNIKSKWEVMLGGNTECPNLLYRFVRKFCNVRARCYADKLQKTYSDSKPHATTNKSASLRKQLGTN